MVSELGVHVKHLQDLVSLDGVKVAVAQRPHVGARLPRLREEVDELAEDVVLAWREQVGKEEGEVEEKEEKEEEEEEEKEDEVKEEDKEEKQQDEEGGERVGGERGARGR